MADQLRKREDERSPDGVAGASNSVEPESGELTIGEEKEGTSATSSVKEYLLVQVACEHMYMYTGHFYIHWTDGKSCHRSLISGFHQTTQLFPLSAVGAR